MIAGLLVLAGCSADLEPGGGQGVDATRPGALLLNADGQSEQFSGVAMLRGSSACTGFVVDTEAPDRPALVLTNGHCVGIFDATSVLVDDDTRPTTVTFGAFVDTPDELLQHDAPVVRWATMRGTDLAVLELGVTLGELQADGVRAYTLAPPAPVGARITVVGVPVAGVDASETFLRRVDCRVLRNPVRLLEWRWVWDAAQPNDCRGILGGNSGSPVFDAAGRVAGIINTTTVAAPVGGECDLGRPCEIGPDGPVLYANTSYAQPVDVVIDCLVDGRLVLGAACPLESADPIAVSQVQLYGRSPWNWSADVAAPSWSTVAVKAGPIATTDCRAADGYGPAGPPSGYTGPMAVADGTEVLCVAGLSADGTLDLGSAGFAVATTDTTPPVGPVELAVNGDEEFGYFFEPIFNPPDLSDFLVAYGPTAAVDCADESQYAPYRRVPFNVEPAALPAKVCVIGFDNARNATEPVEFSVP